VAKLPHLLLRLQNQVKRVRLMPLRLAVLIGLLTHLFSCAWRLARRADRPAREQPGAEWWQEYIMDVYWVQMTMTTVGFGDVSPCGFCSRIFAVFSMLVAPLFFGTVVSVLTVFSHRVFHDEADQLAHEADQLMRRRGVSTDLQLRVEQDLRRRVRQERQMASAAGLLGRLSPAVQRELSLELLSSVVLRFPLFRAAPRAFVAEIASAHAWVQCAPGDLVVEEGQVIQEVVFLVHGRLLVHRSDTALPSPASPSSPRIWRSEEAEVPEGRGDAADGGITAGSRAEGTRVETLEITELEDGAWFGEACLFAQKVVRTFGAIAVAETELAVLPARGYRRVLQRYPHLLERHGAMHRALRESRLDLADLAWKPAD